MALKDLISASNLSDFYEAQEVPKNIGDRLFPAQKHVGLKLDLIKGANNKAVALKPSAFDTQASLRDRMAIDLTSEKMPLFREGMLIKEEDRQQILMLEQAGNQTALNAVLQRIYNDQATLLTAARSRYHAMRMQVLATGRLEVVSNGINLAFDYGVPEANQGDVETDWSEANADPLKDIDNAIEKMAELGITPSGMVLNATTYGQIRKAETTSKAVTGVKSNQATRRQLEEFLTDEYGLNVVIVNGTYNDEHGESHKYFPDGFVTFIPNQAVGYTNFGTTPEEADLQMGSNNVDVSIVDTGVAITSETKSNPVNVETIVSMLNLPSFEGAGLVYQLKTDLSEPVEADPEPTEGV